MTTPSEERFLAAALSEGGQPVAAGGPSLKDLYTALGSIGAPYFSSPQPRVSAERESTALPFYYAAESLSEDIDVDFLSRAFAEGQLLKAEDLNRMFAEAQTLKLSALSLGLSGSSWSREPSRYLSLMRAWHEVREKVDLQELSSQLALLRQAIKEEVKTAEGAIVLGQVASAEIAASRGNGPYVLMHLRGAGVVALEAAQRLGLLVALEATQAALRL
jgi:hypothetical protein